MTTDDCPPVRGRWHRRQRLALERDDPELRPSSGNNIFVFALPQ